MVWFGLLAPSPIATLRYLPTLQKYALPNIPWHVAVCAAHLYIVNMPPAWHHLSTQKSRIRIPCGTHGTWYTEKKCVGFSFV